jgi:hypothetical protein
MRNSNGIRTNGDTPERHVCTLKRKGLTREMYCLRLNIIIGVNFSLKIGTRRYIERYDIYKILRNGYEKIIIILKPRPMITDGKCRGEAPASDDGY